MLYESVLDQRVFILRNVFDEEECHEWIEFAEDEGFETAPISSGGGTLINPNVRDNLRCTMLNHEWAELVWENILEYIPDMEDGRSPIGINEFFRVYRYDEGHFMSTHQDFSYQRPDSDECSVLTALIYLSDDFQGGETIIYPGGEKELVIEPELGMILFFEHELWHEGNPVLSGQKYVLRTDVMYL